MLWRVCVCVVARVFQIHTEKFLLDVGHGGGRFSQDDLNGKVLGSV